jgi:hypothetical protein
LGAFVAYSIIFLVMAWMLSQFVRPRGTPSIATHPRWLERNRKWQRNSPEVPLPLGRLSVDR